MAQQDDQLKAYDVNLTVIKQLPNENRLGSVQWPWVYWWPSYQQYRWKNATNPAVHDYAAFYCLKYWLAAGIDTAISMWYASKQMENPETVSEYKVGVEVKTIFKKNQIDLLCPNSGLKH